MGLMAGGVSAAALNAGKLPLFAETLSTPRRPNVIYAFSDEHRWHSMSFSTMPELQTPNLKRLADEGIEFTNCISNYPVCSPHRAMLMTGRWPYQQGMIDNDLKLSNKEATLGKSFKEAGYTTGYVGKWHLGDSNPRAEAYGFDLSLIWTDTNSHWKSKYHPKDRDAVESKEYNASAMTSQALEFIDKNHKQPFFLMLSWNPPHSNFNDAPDDKKKIYHGGKLSLRDNVKKEGVGKKTAEEKIDPSYIGYHAHITAIDEEMGRILKKLDDLGIAQDTIVFYSSDHGSMFGSHGMQGKRLPFEESIRVPFLARWPKVIPEGKQSAALFGAIDIMPSICALAGLKPPASCVGLDFSPIFKGEKGPDPESQFIMHISKEHASLKTAPLFRGVRTKRHTYAVYPNGPWCLYDNEKDPYQLQNLIDDPASGEIRKELRAQLAEWLKKAEDPFKLPV